MRVIFTRHVRVPLSTSHWTIEVMAAQYKEFKFTFQVYNCISPHWKKPLKQVRNACYSSSVLCSYWYNQTSNIGRIKSPNLNVSCLVLHLPLPNPMKPGVENEDVADRQFQTTSERSKFFCQLRFACIRGLRVGVFNSGDGDNVIISSPVITGCRVFIADFSCWLHPRKKHLQIHWRLTSKKINFDIFPIWFWCCISFSHSHAGL